MGRRKKDEGGGVPEWMCTFGDMMSLLLCFFIMLFALSIITPIKWEAIIETQNMKLGYPSKSPTPSNANKPSGALGSTSERSRRTAAFVGGQPTPGPAGEASNLQTIRTDGDRVKGGLIRFDLGSDILDAQAETDLQALLPVLAKSPNKIQVVGYVSPNEAEGKFSRDDFLAQSRAIKVTDYLLEQGVEWGIQEDFFQISLSTNPPDRAVLPARTDPKRAGASAAVYLIRGVSRPNTPE